MYAKLRQWWPVAKVVFLLALAFFIGRLFYKDLARPELWQRSFHPAWLVLAGLLYLTGLAFSAFYWRRLLLSFNQTPSRAATVRAYYIGHLGKYVPGKAWALFMRANLIRPAGVRPALATLTSFYEVLTTMASGALVALVLFAVFGQDTTESIDWNTFVQMVRLEAPEGAAVDRKIAVLLALLLLCVIGGPILPLVFNRIVHHVSLPFRERITTVPRFKTALYLEGLALTSVGWLFLGLSLLAVLRALVGPEMPWTWQMAGRVVGVMGLAYVAGFIILIAPGGLVAREYFLVLFLMPELMTVPGIDANQARELAILASVVLRLVWTAAELVCAAVVYWLPAKPYPAAVPPDAPHLAPGEPS